MASTDIVTDKSTIARDNDKVVIVPAKLVEKKTYTFILDSISIKRVFTPIVESPDFPESDKSMQWTLILHLKGDTNPDYFSLYLCPVNRNKPEVVASFSLSILNLNNCVVIQRQYPEHTFRKPFVKYGSSEFARIKDLNNYVYSDQLKVRIVIEEVIWEVMVSNKPFSHKPNEQDTNKPSPPTNHVEANEPSVTTDRVNTNEPSVTTDRVNTNEPSVTTDRVNTNEPSVTTDRVNTNEPSVTTDHGDTNEPSATTNHANANELSVMQQSDNVNTIEPPVSSDHVKANESSVQTNHVNGNEKPVVPYHFETNRPFTTSYYNNYEKENIHIKSTASEKITYTWTIKSFSKLEKNLGFCLNSSVFPKTKESSQWHLSFYPNGDKDPSYCSLYLCPVNYDKALIKASFSLSLLNLEMGTRLKKEISQFTFQNPFVGRGFAEFASISDMNKHVVHDQLKIRIILEAEYTKVGTLYENLSTDPVHKLLEDLQQLLACHDFADLAIRVDSVCLKVHKNILAARSPVFSNMLKTLDKKFCDRESDFNITSMDKSTVILILQFIYFGKVDISNDDQAKKLMVAAAEYDLNDLKQKCEYFLLKGLKLSNVVEISVLADQNKANKLKAGAIAFVINNFHEFRHKEYQNMAKSAPNLLADILEQMQSKIL